MTLKDIYNKTDGHCSVCEKKLVFTNYNNEGAKGAWKVVDTNPGGDKDLFPVCVSCRRNIVVQRHSAELISKVYDKTAGHCQYCDMKLASTNYNNEGAKGAWLVVHGKPPSKAGSNHINNLFPACISCARAKGNKPRPPDDW